MYTYMFGDLHVRLLGLLDAGLGNHQSGVQSEGGAVDGVVLCNKTVYDIM